MNPKYYEIIDVCLEILKLFYLKFNYFLLKQATNKIFKLDKMLDEMNNLENNKLDLSQTKL